MRKKSYYRSAVGEQIIMAQYDGLLARWPVPYELLSVSTRYGKTHIIASGEPVNPPLLLLHGRSTNATMWVLDIAHYSTHHRVYAVDVLGEPGKSDPVRLKGQTPDYGEWMRDIFDHLAIRQAIILGISFGSWLAVKSAILMPDRILGLVLLSPAGLTYPNPQTIFRAALTLLPSKIWTRRFLESLAVTPLSDEAWELMSPILA